jgi:acetyl esterase/lipase
MTVEMLRRVIALACLLVVCCAQAQQRLSDVIYLKAGGVAFTMDVFKPEKPNGAAVMWMVSGGWISNHESINPDLAKAFTDHGYTFIEVVHGSQPKYTIAEILAQVQRAIRFVRTHASEYGVNPERIGISGGSAGGHISLMEAGMADEGKADAKDPVDRASSRVAAVAVLFPATDFTRFGEGANLEAMGKDPKYAGFMPAFGITPATTPDQLAALAQKLSPIFLVTPKFPPTFIAHGDADELVPLQQSQSMIAALEKAGVKNDLLVVKGAGHDPRVAIPAFPKILAWFDLYLK